MDLTTLLSHCINAPILFFLLGMLITACKVNLVIPDSVSKFLSLYLLIAIGFNGGVELRHAGISQESIISLGFALILAALIPLYVFFVLRLKFDVYNAAGLAASYGSVGAVTFIIAAAMLKAQGVPFGGYMVAALALMEAPAIIISIFLARRFSSNKDHTFSLYDLIHESFFNGSVFLIMGSLCIGILVTAQEASTLQPFTSSIFRGLMCFFMLDVGILAAQKLHDLKKNALFLIPCAIIIPLINGLCTLALSYTLHLSAGDSFLLAALAASASYIAVPAALRVALPQANPSLYIPMALGITFPFNIMIGLPLYYSIMQALW